MIRKTLIAIATLLVVLMNTKMAQATYYHFENYRWDNVVFQGTGSTYSWQYDLNADDLSLWVINDNPLQNSGGDWYGTPTIGSMDTDDILHRAFLTMRFCNARGDTIDFLLDDVLQWDNKILTTNGGTGTINVLTQLFDDHFLEVTITSVSGAFTVDWMTLAGCYETGPDPVPAPEPATVVLIGLGMGALGLVSRWKR